MSNSSGSTLLQRYWEAYQALPAGVKAAVEAAPSEAAAAEVIYRHINDDPDVGRAAAEAIGNVAYGSIGAAFAKGLTVTRKRHGRLTDEQLSSAYLHHPGRS